MLPRLQFNSVSLKQIGLSIGAILLGGSPIVPLSSSAQALPSQSPVGYYSAYHNPSSPNSNSPNSSYPNSRYPNSRYPNSSYPNSNSPSRSTTAQNLNEVRFECQAMNGQPTVMYRPQSQPGQAYPWATPTALGGGWSSTRRCDEISRRLEFYRPDGLLELQTGLENGYNTICVTTEAVSSCRIVLTVPPGQDPVAIRDRIFNNLLVADSGEQTTAVTAYQGEDGSIINQLGRAIGINLPSNRRPNSPSSINLRPFLDPADGGTGAQLRNMPVTPAQTAPATNNRLNPGNFR